MRLPSVSGSKRQESSGVHRESRTGRWGGNEGTGARTEKTSFPQKPGGCGPADHSGKLGGSPASQVKNSPEAPAATSSCRSHDRGQRFQATLGHRLGHTCFCPETLMALSWKIWVDRNLPLNQGLEKSSVPNLPSTLTCCQNIKPGKSILADTLSSTCKEPGGFPSHSSHVASRRPSMALCGSQGDV